MSDSTPTKFCRKCQRDLLTNEFYPSSRTDDGWREYCIDCCFAYKGRPRPARKPIAPPGAKYCAKCHQLKPLTSEYFNRNGQQKSGFTPKCRECRMSERRGVPESDQSKQKRLAYRRQHRAQEIARASQWVKSNPERARTGHVTITTRYRARKRHLPDGFTSQDWQHALDYFDHRCAVCKRPIGLWHTLAQDHWIPISRGGPTVPQNIVPLCQGAGGCNNSKGNGDPLIWLISKFGERRAKQIVKYVESYFTTLEQH